MEGAFIFRPERPHQTILLVWVMDINMVFEELAKKISPILKRITYRLNGHYSTFNHDDLYQEALLRLWLDFNEGKLADKTQSYILQGCYFHLKNYIRMHYDKAGIVSIDSMVNSAGDELRIDEIISIEDPVSIFDKLNSELIIEAIQNNGLTSREKEVFNFALEGLTTREIGSRMGISHVRVVKIKAKIREKCKKHLDN